MQCFRASQKATQGYFLASRSLTLLFHRRLDVPLLWLAYEYMMLYRARVPTVGGLSIVTELCSCRCISCHGSVEHPVLFFLHWSSGDPTAQPCDIDTVGFKFLYMTNRQSFRQADDIVRDVFIFNFYLNYTYLRGTRSVSMKG